MATIFISHSKRDIELVNSIKIILENIGHVPIIEEYIPKENQAEIPYEEIRKNVMASDYMFLFFSTYMLDTHIRYMMNNTEIQSYNCHILQIYHLLYY